MEGAAALPDLFHLPNHELNFAVYETLLTTGRPLCYDSCELNTVSGTFTFPSFWVREGRLSVGQFNLVRVSSPPSLPLQYWGLKSSRP